MNTPMDDDNGQKPVTFSLPEGTVRVTVQDLDAIRRAVIAYLQTHLAKGTDEEPSQKETQAFIKELGQAEPFTIEGESAHIGIWQLNRHDNRWQLTQVKNLTNGAARAIRPYAFLEHAQGKWTVMHFGFVRVRFKSLQGARS